MDADLAFEEFEFGVGGDICDGDLSGGGGTTLTA